MTMNVQSEKARNQGGGPYSKRGMQDVFLYAQKPFILPEMTTGHSPSFES